MISKKAWAENKKYFLERAGLTEFEDADKILKALDKILQTLFEQVNKNVLEEKNPFVRLGAQDHLIVTTPPLKEKESAETQVMDLFPQDRFISLFEILSTVNNVVPFIERFEHWKIKKHWQKPDAKIFFAGIIGLGCNLGIKKISRISSNINQNSLENTVRWYFSEDNLNNANKMILEVIDQLSLPRLYQKDLSLVHTSSDGQKFGIGVDSLHSNYSFKYFGQGKGVTSYTFNDDKHRLFYSTVISPSEREAAYVIDGLLQNNVVESDIHSTDTHGYTELVFAVTHLLGVSFAPRIKDFRDQRLFSFEPRLTYTGKGYKILPDE
ncbi:MAG: Tn3 family transposase, partial [Nitrosotalea sp.]